MTLQEGVIYPGISQDQRSFNSYSFQIINKTAAFLNSSYLYIRVDIDDATSDPDILVAKLNSTRAPKSESESDIYCVKTGSNVCILKKNQYKPNDVIQFNVRCVNKCTYTMKVAFSSVTNITDGKGVPMRLEGRSANVFQFYIPDVSYDGLTQSIQFSAETNSTTSQIQILFSVTDDLTLMEERDVDITTEQGRAVKFTSDDYGWCTKCVVFFVISVKSPDLYLISGKSTARKELLQDQQTISRSFNQQQRECLSYVVSKSVNDVVFYVKQQYGDSDISLFLRNPLNQSYEQQIIQSEFSAQRAVIARSSDRQRYNQTISPIYVCVNPYVDSSIQVTPNQQYQLGRFDAMDDTLYTFNLDSQDYIYFRYSNPALTVSRQLQIQIQSFNSNFNVPRIFYKVCASPNPEECSLTDNLAMGVWDGNQILSEINSTFDATTNIKTGIINHNPISCPISTQCYYLISVFNQDLSGPQKFTFKLNQVQSDPTPVQLFQQYTGIVNQGQMQYFQLMISQNQLNNLIINQLFLNLTNFNGRAELFLSTQVSNPNINNYEVRSRSLSPWVQIAYNTSGKDFTKTIIYLGILGVQQTQYQLRIGADYSVVGPIYIQNNTFNQINVAPVTPNITNIVSNVANITALSNVTNTSIPGIQNTTNLTIYPIPIVEGFRGQYQITSNMTDVIIFYQFNYTNIMNKVLQFQPTIDSMTPNSTLTFNVTYGNQSWNNNTIGLTLYATQWKYDPASIFVIRIRGDFSKVNRSLFNISTNTTPVIKNVTNSTKTNSTSPSTPAVAPQLVFNLTFRFGIFSSYQSQKSVNYTNLNTQYESFANYSTVTFKHLLMDTDGTYEFTLYNSIGKPYFMQKNGPLLLQDFDITDDTTYDFASSSVDTQETQKITVTKAMREGANFRCKNASYPIKGGNENCTMFIAIECGQLCIFNLSIRLIEAQNRSVDIPTLFSQGQILNNQNGVSNKSTNYYLPFVRGQLADSAIALTKVTNDSFIVAKVISNGYLPYYNWSYPTQISYDFISKNSNNIIEVLDLSGPALLQRCPVQTSCVLLVSVFASSNNSLNLTKASFKLNFLTQNNRISNMTLINGTMTQLNSYDYYWFLFTQNLTQKTPQAWKYLITTSTTGYLGDQEIDLYISAGNGNYPTSENFDFKGDRLGNDAVTLSSDNNFFKNSLKDKFLVIVGVKAKSSNLTYQLMNWGPTSYDQQLINFTDISLKTPVSLTLPSKTARPVNNYIILRYFNYGSRDLTFNITAQDGQIYVLANKNNYKHYEINSYFNVPLIVQNSKIAPYNLNKSQSYIFKVNKNVNSDMLCTFCWIYLNVFQNNSLPQNTSRLSINVIDTGNTDYIQNLKIGETQSQMLSLQGSSMQRKFIFDSKDQFTLQVLSNTSDYQVFLGYYTDYLNNDIIWRATGNTRQTFKFKQSDRKFLIGSYYYVTVVSNSTATNITLSLSQRRTVTLLRDQTNFIDRMQTSEDYIKYYYFVPTVQPMNYTATITITPRTQGFYPSFYAQRNDLLNSTFNYKSLVFPSMNRSTFSQEQQFFIPPQQSYQFSFNVSAVYFNTQIPVNISQNVTVNQTQLVNVTMNITNTTTKKNQTVVVQQNQTVLVNVTKNITILQNITTMNQTYYTFAVYWNNFGLTDIQRTEFEVSYI